MTSHHAEHTILAIMTNFLSQGGGVLPYMGYIGMSAPLGYGFSAVLVINEVLSFKDPQRTLNELTI